MALSPTIRAIQPQHRRPFVPKTIYTLSSTNLSQIFSITLKPLYPILNHYTNLQPSNRTPILPRVHPATTMARTCSHAPSSVASRPLIPRRSQRISNALKITKPSSPTPKAKQSKHQACKILASNPAEENPALVKANLNAPTQLSGLVKVFDTVSLILRLYAPPHYLSVLNALRATIYDFITNYGVDGWCSTRPHDPRVLSDIHRLAEGMAWDEDVAVYEHAARGALVMVHGGDIAALGEERVSEVHLGMWEFVGWIVEKEG
jgi:hypothetical protein